MNRIRSLTVAIIAFACVALSPCFAQDAEIATKFDKPPAPTKTPPPVYPASLKGVNGMVAVTIIIDETGAVTDAKIAKSSDPGFEAPSLEAIKRWKFKPAEIGGQPVKAKVTVPLRFNAES